jgi:hypothetical protein
MRKRASWIRVHAPEFAFRHPDWSTEQCEAAADAMYVNVQREAARASVHARTMKGLKRSA